MIKMVEYEGGPVPEELCTMGRDGIADDFVGCGECFNNDSEADCETCIVNKLFKEYAKITHQIKEE